MYMGLFGGYMRICFFAFCNSCMISSTRRISSIAVELTGISSLFIVCLYRISIRVSLEGAGHTFINPKNDEDERKELMH